MAKPKMRIENNFRTAAKAGHEATLLAVGKALEAGETESKKRLGDQASRRGYNLSADDVKKENRGWYGAVFVEEWWYRFFEYGTVYIEAMPFIRPGSRKMRKTFRDIMGDDFEKFVSRRSKVRRTK